MPSEVPDSAKRDQLEQLFNIAANFGWSLTAGINCQDVIAKTVNSDAPVHIELTTTDNSAHIAAVIPGTIGPKLCKIRLRNSLDPVFGFLECKSEFVKQVSDAHFSIAQRYTIPYLSPVENPQELCRGIIPIEFESAEFEQTMRACTYIAEDTERLHAMIEHPLSIYT